MATLAEGPTVALSFANNFWGKDDAGVLPLLERMHSAKLTCDEVRSFYGTRASIEDEYARKLLSLSRKALGSHETGSLKTSLDTVRAELDAMAKQHQNIAAQMRSELEEPLVAFAGGMKERRKIIQNTVEKLLKVKVQQTQLVNKTRDRYEQECLKIKGYLAQGHMVMGQEERRNKAKLEKTQISVETTNSDYEAAVKVLEETTARWNREWKGAADKFQDLEEERLDFTKSSLWTFANITSTVCVSDDASCERIRLSLEKMEVEKDILAFIHESGTGQDIPDAPRYIDFRRGDVDTQSDASADAAAAAAAADSTTYSVAQFPRSINPAFRSSSPQPSTFESHHDPNSALAKTMGHGNLQSGPSTPSSREASATPQKMPVISPEAQRTPQQVTPQQQLQLQQQQQQQKQMQMQMQMQQPGAPPVQELQKQQQQQPLSVRGQPSRGYQPPRVNNLEYDPTEFAPVPHDPYPMDGMTMLCRPTASDLSAASTAPSSARPSSRDDSHSETSFSSLEPAPPAMAPAVANTIKQQQQLQQQQKLQQQQLQELGLKKTQVIIPASAAAAAGVGPGALVPASLASASSSPSSPEKKTPPVQKKSGFFQNHSPFRRKSNREAPGGGGSRNTWHPANNQTRAPLFGRESSTGNVIGGAGGTGSQAASNSISVGGGMGGVISSSGNRNGSFSSMSGPASPTSPNHTSNSNNIGSSMMMLPDRTASPDPVPANASLALNVGNNVFAVDAPRPKPLQKGAQQQQQPAPDEDPIAMALAELKGISKQSSVRMSADHYHGITTPAPGAVNPLSRSMPTPGRRGTSPGPAAAGGAIAAGMRGTPPPSYEQQQQVAVSRLGVPPPAVTSRAMKESSRKFEQQTRSMFGRPPDGRSGSASTTNGGPAPVSYMSGANGPAGATANGSMSRSGARGGGVGALDMPRAASPAPPRSASPRPGSRAAAEQQGYYASTQQQQQQQQQGRAASPNPYASSSSPRGGGAQMAMMSAGKRGSEQSGFYAHQQQQQQQQQQQRQPSPSPYSIRGGSAGSGSIRGGGGGGGGDYGGRPGSSMTMDGGSINKKNNSSSSNNSMAVQLAPVPVSSNGMDDGYGSGGGGGGGGYDSGGSMSGRNARGRQHRGGSISSVRPCTSGNGSSREMSFYEGAGPVVQQGQAVRTRSKSLAADPGRAGQFANGRPIMHFARALYMYQAAIPEELGFSKGDILAVLRHQDDGWWEATVQGAGTGLVGLVPSNYLQPL